MIDEQFKVPLSPPNSPRMSDKASKTSEYQWQHPQVSSIPSPVFARPHLQPYPTGGLLIAGAAQDHQQQHGESNRPPLRSHKSFPYSLGPSSRLQQGGSDDQPEARALVEFREQVTSQGPQPVGTSDLPPATFGGSAPTSPIGRLTPRSGEVGTGEEGIEDEDMGFDAAEGADEEDEKRPMTAAELRAHKRKMKRFRLTHNQTRFLMSEFARQPHPDAAHRERLSREIPGLSPRQVQVWFQNRRAKLKRLTTDDRERIMRSRALPADFDMTQALHSPFGSTAPQNMGTPMPSPSTYTSFGEANGLRPLTLDTLRRVPEYDSYSHQQYASPTGITPAMGAFAFTPPQSATDTMSPASVVSSASAYTFQTQESPRRFPYGLSIGAQPGYGSQHPHMPRLHMHDRRPLGESAGSPLRTSMSYSGLGSPSGHMLNQAPGRSSSFSEHTSAVQDRPQQHRSLTGPVSNPSTSAGPIGLGFTYAHMPPYSNADNQHHHQPSTAGQQQSDTQYRRASSHLAGPPISGYQQYQPAPFGTPQVSQYPGFPSHYTASHFPSAYHQQLHPQTHQPSFQSVPSQPQQFVTLSSSSAGRGVDEGSDNSEGGVPLPQSY